MRTCTRLLLPAVAAALLVAPPAGAATLRADVEALVEAGAPGAILLTRDGPRTRRYAAGLADVARKRPMRPADRFRISSLTKTYTATVVLQLVAEGRLSLDDTVERWLPGLVPGGNAITVHQLLAHTTGLFDHENDPRVLAPYLAGNFAHFWPPRTLVEIAAEHPPLFPPGARRSYSNTNYVILGLVIEAVTGRPVGEALATRLFAPLRLRATEYPTSPRIAGRHAHGYLIAERPPAIDVTLISPSLSPASGAIVSNARDVAAFYRALLAGRLLRPDLLEAMKTTLEDPAGDIPGQRHGLGLELFPTRCGAAWGHNGTHPGYFVFAYSSEDGARQAVLMVNMSATSLPPRAARAFFRLIERAYCSTA